MPIAKASSCCARPASSSVSPVRAWVSYSRPRPARATARSAGPLDRRRTDTLAAAARIPPITTGSRPRAHLAAAGARLRELLQRHGLAPDGGTDLFQWIQIPDAAAWHDALAREAVLTRRFDTPSSLRFGLPSDEASWEKLDLALARVASVRRNPSLPNPPLEGEDSFKPSASRGGHGWGWVPASPQAPSQRLHRARVLMVQGTTSDAGKSTLVAGLCRWLHRRGVAVAPFKPQNMALNSAVTVDGGEIGRAQALQAQAAGSAAAYRFQSGPAQAQQRHRRAGHHPRSRDRQHAVPRNYHDYKRVAMEAVLASHARLCERYDAVIVEGAGSPAEINLRANDIANMGYAEAVDCPVMPDRRHRSRRRVRASRRHARAACPTASRPRIKGFVINRFRGDIALLQPGLDWLEATHRQTGAGRTALPAGPAPRCRGRAAARRRHAADGDMLPRGRAGAAAHQQSHRFRCAARHPQVDLPLRRRGRADPRRRT